MKYIYVIFTLLIGLSSFAQTAEDFFISGNTKFDNKDFLGAISDFSQAISLD